MSQDFESLAHDIRRWALELGFTRIGIADTHLPDAERRLQQWLRRGYAGRMHWMHRHGTRRSRPSELIPDTLRVISVAMDYLPEPQQSIEQALTRSDIGYISRYALGRDYHKVMRKRLVKLAKRIRQSAGSLGYRPFCDSAPVMEKPLAEKAGLGWIGKHTNLLSRDSGSWFFLGELYVNLPLPVDRPVSAHCGSCTACIDICPTRAIVAPWVLDARRCISYLTIELHGSIPEEFRSAIGNRIYGCDDCQLVCPWNRYAKITAEPDFLTRHPLHNQELTKLFYWDEATFLKHTEGTAIRRIGYLRWLRNLAVALGNAPRSESVTQALMHRSTGISSLVREHVQWALQRHTEKSDQLVLDRLVT